LTQYIDISVPISQDLPTWPGSPEIELYRNLDLNQGDVANDTTLNFSVHTGTHIDAPLHFIQNGKSVDQISLETLIGSVFVTEVANDVTIITADVLDSLEIPPGIKRLLLKTQNSQLWSTQVKEFQPDFVALTPDAAQWVVDREIGLIGVDYLSVQRFHDGPETHQILLGAEVVIIEGLNLADIKTGYYELICLPIKLRDSEGAPARVILKRLSDIE
jgi:arylformamidase